MKLCLYQPDIPQNVGTLLRLSACLGLDVEIIEPCGFIFSDHRLKRSGMDYLEHVNIHRYTGWQEFITHRKAASRLVLLSPHASLPYTDLDFRADDCMMVGQESVGVPEHIYQQTDIQICIPMKPGMRSMNVATAASLVIGEALRQTKGFEYVSQS